MRHTNMWRININIHRIKFPLYRIIKFNDNWFELCNRFVFVSSFKHTFVAQLFQGFVRIDYISIYTAVHKIINGGPGNSEKGERSMGDFQFFSI